MTDKVELTSSFEIAAHIHQLFCQRPWQRAVKAQFDMVAAGLAFTQHQIDLINSCISPTTDKICEKSPSGLWW